MSGKPSLTFAPDPENELLSTATILIRAAERDPHVKETIWKLREWIETPVPVKGLNLTPRTETIIHGVPHVLTDLVAAIYANALEMTRDPITRNKIRNSLSSGDQYLRLVNDFMKTPAPEFFHKAAKDVDNRASTSAMYRRVLQESAEDFIDVTHAFPYSKVIAGDEPHLRGGQCDNCCPSVSISCSGSFWDALGCFFLAVLLVIALVALFA
jgi:hypothetical protein